MKEALARIKEELGEDAMIIKSEKVRAGGTLGKFREELIEVTAAAASEVKAELQPGPEFADSLQQSLDKAEARPRAMHPPEQNSQLEEEVRHLREEIADIGKQLKNTDLARLPRDLAKIREDMGEAGMSRDWAGELAQDALIHLGAEELVSPESIERHLVSRLAQVVKPAAPPTARRRSAYKVALVGAPGAGKTTLLQKLVSDPAAYAKRKIGLISLDTHRMAAIEQLRTFARIAGTPLEVVFKAAHVTTALSRLSGSEIILVDTPGCPAWDAERLDLLRSFMDALNPEEIHLVQNATVRDEDLIYAGRRFRDLNITHLSFTRLDESLRHGCLLNVVKATEKPVAWLSRGQSFVGCLERFTPDHLRRWIALSDTAREALSAVTESKHSVIS